MDPMGYRLVVTPYKNIKNMVFGPILFCWRLWRVYGGGFFWPKVEQNIGHEIISPKIQDEDP